MANKKFYEQNIRLRTLNKDNSVEMTISELITLFILLPIVVAISIPEQSKSCENDFYVSIQIYILLCMNSRNIEKGHYTTHFRLNDETRQ